MTDYDILGGSLVLVGCLAKRKLACDQSKSSEKIRYRTILSYWNLFVKEDRETGNVVQKPCLFMRQSRRVQLNSRSICDFVARLKSRTRATKSRDTITGVTSVLGLAR